MRQSGTATRGKLIAWAALLATAIYIVLVGGNTVLVRDANSRLMLQVLTVSILGAWFIGSLVQGSWRSDSPLLVPILVAASVYLLAAVFSQRPRLSLEPMLGGVAWAFAYLLLSRILKDHWFRARLAPALILFVALVASGYVLQVVLEWIRWWGVVGSLVFPPLRPGWARLIFNSPNDIPAILSLAAPLAVAVLGRRRLLPATALAVLALVAVFVSGSRGALLGFAVMTFLLVAVSIATGAWQDLAARTRRIWGTRWVFVVAATVVGLAVVFTPALAARLAQGGDTVRYDLWRSALTIFAGHPLTGSGPGTWVQLKLIANPPGVPNNIFSGAHNDFLQAAAEIGLIGLLAFGYLSFVVVRRLAIGLTSTGPMAIEALAVLAGLAGFAVQCLFENFALRPLMIMLVLVGIAWVDAIAPLEVEAEVGQDATTPPSRRRQQLARALPVVGLAGLIVSSGVIAWSDAAALEDAQGTTAVWNGDWSAAAKHFDAARTIDPGLTIYAIRAASAHARLGELGVARSLLQDAIIVDPIAVNILGVGSLDAAIDGPQAGLPAANVGARMGSGSPTVALNAALLAEGAGDTTFALDQFANAIAFDPALAGTDLWASPRRQVSFDAVVDASVVRSDPLTGALILGYAGRATEARARLNAVGPSVRRDTYSAVLSWLDGHIDEARSGLAAQLEADPLDWFAASWLSRIERLSGSAAAAARYEAWAMTVQADRAPGVILEASVVPAQSGAATAGLPAAYPSAIYFRDTGGFLLMPGLVLIGYR